MALRRMQLLLSSRQGISSHIFPYKSESRISSQIPRQQFGFVHRYPFATSPDPEKPQPESPAPEKPPSETQSESPPRTVADASRSWLQSKLKSLIQDLNQVPTVAKTLGLAGAIPFICLAPPIVYVLPLPELLYATHVEAQASYGALILSFLGGPHWGLAMSNYNANRPISFTGVTTSTFRYVWGVSPSLLGWFAILLPSSSDKLCVLIPSFGLALAVDYVMVKQSFLPAWYLPLRIILTGIAVLSMGSSLLLVLAKDIPQKLQHSEK